MNIINPFDFELSSEQVDIIKACITEPLVSIEACAGAAKTTSLSAVANNLPSKSLFLTFSKALADEARKEFPSYVDCRTIHSLAYKHVGCNYQHKLSRPHGGYKNVCGTGKEIAMYFKIQPIQVGEEDWITSAYIGQAIKNCLMRYENSADKDITSSHIIYSDIKALVDKHKKAFTNAKEKAFVKVVVSNAKKLWKLRTDIKSDVICTHDTYLKLYELSKPVIETEVLYLDECQDLSSVFVSIVLNQIKLGHCKIVSVGDRDQSIYKWRYSVMLSDYLDSAKQLNLSHSFRYGQRVADIAMRILDNGKSIVGFDKVDTKVSHIDTSSKWKKVAMLFRTNHALVDTALELLESGESVSIEIDVEDYLSLLDSMYALKEGKLDKIKHSSIMAYTEWGDFEEDVGGDASMKRVYDIIRRGDYWEVKQILTGYKRPRFAKYHLTTAHKAKGQTFDNVLLAEDYPSNYDKNGEWKGVDEETKRLLYVAVTRAKHNLVYNSTVKEILDYQNGVDQFRKLVKSEVDDLAVSPFGIYGDE